MGGLLPCALALQVIVGEEMKKAMHTGVKVNQELATHYAKKPKNTINTDSEPSESEPSDSESSDLVLSSDEE